MKIAALRGLSLFRAPAPPSALPALVPETPLLSATDPEFERLYGSGITRTDRNSNVIVGVKSDGFEVRQITRFRIPRTTTITKYRTYFQHESGYAAGNGGTIRIRVCEDDGSTSHLPNESAVLGSGSITFPTMVGGEFTGTGQEIYDAHFPEITFDSPFNVTRGQLVHLIHENIDASPAANYISVNNYCRLNDNLDAYALNKLDASVLLQLRPTAGSGSWTTYDITANALSIMGFIYVRPNLQLLATDGRSMGHQAHQPHNFDNGAHMIKLNGTRKSREVFAARSGVSSEISGVTLTGLCVTTGILRFVFNVDGVDVLTQDISATASVANSAQFPSDTQRILRRFSTALNTPVQWPAGKALIVTMSALSGEFWTHTNRNGTQMFFVADAAWTKSYAQHANNGTTWIGTDSFALTSDNTAHNETHPIILHLRDVVMSESLGSELWDDNAVTLHENATYDEPTDTYTLNRNGVTSDWVTGVELTSGKTYRITFDFIRGGTEAGWAIDLRGAISYYLENPDAGPYSLTITATTSTSLELDLPAPGSSAVYQNFSVREVLS